MITHQSAVGRERRCLHRSLAGAILLSSLTLTACDGLFGLSETDIRVSTDQPSYVAATISNSPGLSRYEVRLIVQVHNRSSRDAVIGTCGASGSPKVGVELLPGSELHRSAFDPIYACGPSQGLVLKGGEVMENVLLLRGPNATVGDTALGALEGRMRLVYSIETAGHSRQIRSNAFSVTLPERGP